ncbi:MAG: 4Fe-4S binding protein [Bacillota bacterium]
MKRQRIRKGLILAALLLFPVTLDYMSPYLIIEGAFQGIVTGSFLAFAAMFISSLLLGRAFCGWLCPGAGLQEACFAVNDARAKGGRANLIKYAIWVPWLAGVVMAAVSAGGLTTVDPLYATDHGISVASVPMYATYYTVIVLFAGLALFLGRRASCHYICWMAPFMILGRRAGNALQLPGLRLSAEPAKCTGCGTCTRNCPMSLDVMAMVEKNLMENDECILCGQCADGCRQKAISLGFMRKTGFRSD